MFELEQRYSENLVSEDFHQVLASDSLALHRWEVESVQEHRVELLLVEVSGLRVLMRVAFLSFGFLVETDHFVNCYFPLSQLISQRCGVLGVVAEVSLLHTEVRGVASDAVGWVS